MYNSVLASNTFYQLLSRILSSGVTLLISIFMVRYSGLESFGSFSVVLAIVMIFVALSDFGANVSAIKLFSDPEYLKQNFTSFLIYRLLISIVSCILYLAFITVFKLNNELTNLALIATPLILLNAFSKGYFLVFQVTKKFKEQFLSTLLSSVISISLLAYLLFFGKITPFAGIMILTISNVTSVGYLSVRFLHLLHFIKIPSKQYIAYLLKDSWILGVTLLINMLMVNIDRVMMTKLSTVYDIGSYSLSYRIFELVLVLPTYMMNVYYPILVNMEDKNRYNRMFRSIIIRFGILGLIISLILLISAPIITIFWSDYAYTSVKGLQILSLGTIFFFLTSPLSWRLVNSARRTNLLVTYSVGLVANILLNYIYLPMYGYIAAAYITGITELVILVFLIVENLKIRQRTTSD